MNIPEKNIHNYLAIAEKAALRSGAYLRRLRKADIIIDSEKGKDLKISADRESERIISTVLRKKTDFSILSEEKGLIKGRSGKYGMQWVVDPLDGSLNLSREIPISCISIALWNQTRPVIGVIYDFSRKEMFSGIVGEGAWLNKRRISVSRINEKKKAILFTGVPTRADFSHHALKSFALELRQYKKARWIGSASLSLAYVASGRADVYLERGIMFWDIAAGLAVVRAAGGKYLLRRSKKDNSCSVYVANKYLF